MNYRIKNIKEDTIKLTFKLKLNVLCNYYTTDACLYTEKAKELINIPAYYAKANTPVRYQQLFMGDKPRISIPYNKEKKASMNRYIKELKSLPYVEEVTHQHTFFGHFILVSFIPEISDYIFDKNLFSYQLLYEIIAAEIVYIYNDTKAENEEPIFARYKNGIIFFENVKDINKLSNKYNPRWFTKEKHLVKFTIPKSDIEPFLLNNYLTKL